MTVKDRQEFKKSMPLAIGVANFVLLLSIAYYVGTWTSEVDSFRQEIVKDLKEHEDEENLHIPLYKLNELFIPRQEMNVELNSIKDILNKMDKKLDKLDKKLETKK